eukprot:scaffold4.g4692.t1
MEHCLASTQGGVEKKRCHIQRVRQLNELKSQLLALGGREASAHLSPLALAPPCTPAASLAAEGCESSSTLAPLVADVTCAPPAAQLAACQPLALAATVSLEGTLSADEQLVRSACAVPPAPFAPPCAFAAVAPPSVSHCHSVVLHTAAPSTSAVASPWALACQAPLLPAVPPPPAATALLHAASARHVMSQPVVALPGLLGAGPLAGSLAAAGVAAPPAGAGTPARRPAGAASLPSPRYDDEGVLDIFSPDFDLEALICLL